MSDEQWLWLFINQRIDTDEKLEHMCPKCREEVTSGHKCTRCGKDITETESFVNPNFDMSKYEELAGKVGALFEEDDYDTVKEVNPDLDDDEFEIGGDDIPNGR